MKIVIVNEKDEEIGLKERNTLDYGRDIYRVSGLWIINGKGQALLARRAFNKKHNPGEWGPAVAGTVEAGESYESNILKEAEEEIGLKGIKFVKGIKKRIHGKHNYFVQWYILKTDKSVEEFKIDKNEVVEVGWFSKADILKMENFLESMRELIEELGF